MNDCFGTRTIGSVLTECLVGTHLNRPRSVVMWCAPLKKPSVTKFAEGKNPFGYTPIRPSGDAWFGCGNGWDNGNGTEAVPLEG